MPSLIDNGAYFFGRETKVPQIVTKRPVKNGKVEIGETTAQEYISSTIPAAEDKSSKSNQTNPNK